MLLTRESDISTAGTGWPQPSLPRLSFSGASINLDLPLSFLHEIKFFTYIYIYTYICVCIIFIYIIGYLKIGQPLANWYFNRINKCMTNPSESRTSLIHKTISRDLMCTRNEVLNRLNYSTPFIRWFFSLYMHTHTHVSIHLQERKHEIWVAVSVVLLSWMVCISQSSRLMLGRFAVHYARESAYVYIYMCV